MLRFCYQISKGTQEQSLDIIEQQLPITTVIVSSRQVTHDTSQAIQERAGSDSSKELAL